MREADRLLRLPFYLFTIIDELKSKAKAKGLDVIDLGMGNPDQPPPKHVIDELCKQAKNPKNHKYSKPTDKVEKDLRRAIADWYKGRFNVELEYETETLPLIGSKEGIAHLSLAYLNHDDIALVPTPAYPVHFNGAIIAGGVLYNIPIRAEEGFKPNLKKLPPEILKKAKLLFISYPHNPTAAVADLAFFQEVADWGKGKDIIVVNDLTYSDIVFDGYKAPSFLQAKGAKDIGIEFHTCSKSYNMAGWRIGFAVGNKTVLKTLAKIKGYMDFGIFQPIQYGAIAALTGPQACVKHQVELYKQRRDIFVDGLNKLGWHTPKPKATFYVWTQIPPKFNALTSMEFATLLIEKAGISVAPGTGFGEAGEGYIRFALVEGEERLKEALERIKKVMEIES